MATALTDNFSYQGSLPNFARDRFETIADMRAYPEYCLDDGHLSFCEEDRNTYKFDRLNDDNETTGRWRQFGGVVTIEQSLIEDFTVAANPSKNLEVIYYLKAMQSNPYNIFADSDVKWINGEPPTVKEEKTYVISVLNNYAVWGEF